MRVLLQLITLLAPAAPTHVCLDRRCDKLLPGGSALAPLFMFVEVNTIQKLVPAYRDHPIIGLYFVKEDDVPYLFTAAVIILGLKFRSSQTRTSAIRVPTSVHFEASKAKATIDDEAHITCIAL